MIDFIVKVGRIGREEGINVVPMIEDEKPRPIVDLPEDIRKIIDQFAGKDFKGRIEEVFTIPTFIEKGPAKLLLVGLGKKEELELDSFRRACGRASIKIDESLNESAVFPVPKTFFKEEDVAQSIVEGVLLSMYRFEKYKSEKREQSLKNVTLIIENENSLYWVKERVEVAKKICRGVYTARDLANMPSNDSYPEKFAEMVQEIGRRSGFNVKVYKIEDLEKMSMGGIVAVGNGSVHKPVLIELEFDGTSGRSSRPYVIVGKAVTFDSGGISIKPSEKMEEMKYDKSGGSAVVGVMEAASLLKLPIRLIGLIPCVENLPSGSAYRPGDIIRFRNGKTAEIISTDAEGRLILADALAYGVEKNPVAIIDLATLTGACIVALGTHASGLFTNNQELAEKIIKSSEKVGERVWQLPLWKQYREQIKSEVADLKNSGGRPAGAITAAAFLSEFVKDIPWV
ncbi:MAG: leucyl aminopeptidase, partial [Aigarchaeota archaeon]|nr:leucyl aminopeptidase [Aigarchaeota archaeon]